MIILIGIMMYLIGCLTAYLLERRITIKETGTWTVFDRKTNILFSAFSWVAVAASFLSNIKYSDKPAKW